MSKRHGAREQKRLAKQKAKRKDKRRELARATSKNPAIRLTAAVHWPIVATLEPERLWQAGIGSLVIARRAPGGRIVAGVFLVDVFCLGVKDVFWRDLSEADYKNLLAGIARAGGPLRDISPERFSKLVHCAVDYAQSFGLPPHPDFHAVRHLMDGIDPSRCDDEFEFGERGTPHYIAGPKESFQTARMLARRVAGAGGHYTIPVGGASLIDGAEFGDDELLEFPAESGPRALLPSEGP